MYPGDLANIGLYGILEDRRKMFSSIPKSNV
jgi:hypothetical protein